MNSVKELMRSEMAALKEFFTEKLETMEEYRIEQKLDTKQAVEAALLAAKEAVREQTTASERAISKSEVGTSKQIDQQGVLINTATLALSDKIEDVKERLTLVEGQSKGSKDVWGYVVGGFGMIVALAALAVAFYSAIHR